MDSDNPPFAPSNEETFHEEEVEYDGYDDLHEQDAVDSETSENETGTRIFSFDRDKHHARKMRHDADTEFEGYGERFRSSRQKSADVEDVSDASSYAASQVSGGSITAETKPIVSVVNEKDIPPNARWIKIDRKLVSPEALDIGGERYEERSDYLIVLRVLTKDEIERYALKTREIREERMERLQQLEEKDGLGAKTPVQDASRDNERRYVIQVGQLSMLVKHGIDPASLSEDQFASLQAQDPAVQEMSIQVYAQNLARKREEADQMLANRGINPAQLSEDQFASFQSQNPATQEKSIQGYLQNLARNQRKDASMSNAEIMSETRSTTTPALDHPDAWPPPPQRYSSHNVSSAGNSNADPNGYRTEIPDLAERQRRVINACRDCRRRKTKCDGALIDQWPCSRCVRLKLHCIPPIGRA